MKHLFAIPVLLSFLLGCNNGSEPIEFPDVIEPIEDMRVDAPSGSADDPYPETFNTASGDEGDYGWVHLRGYFHNDMSNAWSAVRNHLVYVNQRDVTEYSVEELGSEKYDYGYQVHNLVEDIVDVEFDNEWRHAALDGTLEAPERVGIRWQKTAGTEFISHLEGSIQILSLPDGRKDIVEVQIIEHLGALQDQEENAKVYVTDLFERWELVADGEEIPTYEE